MASPAGGWHRRGGARGRRRRGAAFLALLGACHRVFPRRHRDQRHFDAYRPAALRRRGTPSLSTHRWRNADSNYRSSPASARELRHVLARCGRPNVRGLIDEDSNPGPDSDRRSLLPISRFASSYSHRSPIRGLRSGFGRLAGIFAATGFGKPSNSRTNPVSNILYVEGAAPPGAAGSRRPANPAEPLRTIRPERVTPLLKYELRNFRRSLGCRHLVFCRCHDVNNDYHTISK